MTDDPVAQGRHTLQRLGHVPEGSVRPATPADRRYVVETLTASWGSTVIAVGGTARDAADLPALIATHGHTRAGLLTYDTDSRGLEIVSLDATAPRLGAGTALVAAAVDVARRRRCDRVWLITTNDNLDALRFYQRRGFMLAALHRDAVAVARRLKPSIPTIGLDGIPIRDEIELERVIDGGR